MTTDETRDQSGNTPEYVVQEAIYEHDDSWDLNEHIVAALRNEGMLAEGAPADEQVEAATWALIESDTDTSDRGVSDEHYRERRADVERVAPILRAGAAPPAPSDDRESLIAEAQAAWDAAGRMPQGTMVHETQWKPFAALYNVTERLIDALAFPPAPSETRCWCFDLPRGEHHADCEPEPAPSGGRERLVAEARAIVDRAAHGTPSTHAARIRAGDVEDERLRIIVQLADAIAAPAPAPGPLRWKYDGGHGAMLDEKDQVVGYYRPPAKAPVDEAKLAEVVDNAQRRWNGSGRREPIATAITREVVAMLRGDG